MARNLIDSHIKIIGLLNITIIQYTARYSVKLSNLELSNCICMSGCVLADKNGSSRGSPSAALNCIEV